MFNTFRIALAFCLVTALAGAAFAQEQNSNTRVLAMQVGITPESVVIAEFDAAAAQTMLSRIDQATGYHNAIAAEQNAMNQVIDTITELSHTLQTEPGDQDLQQQYDTALAQKNAIQQELDLLFDELFALAVEGYPTSKVQQLEVYHSGLSYRAPAHFRAVERTEAQWKAIEAALRAEARAERLGADLNDEDASLLQAARSEPAVIEAQMRLENNLASIKAVFSNY